MFRKLRADEIECRVQAVKPSEVSLLLYKTARTDRNILDEYFGVMGWQNDFKVIDGKMYGSISIWDKEKGQWITKSDCGTESNTEAEKGQASDCFKRAGFKWGIGVELYSSPFIRVKGDGNELKKRKFKVSSISYNDNGDISNLEIVDDKGNTVYSMGKKVTKTTHKTEEKVAEPVEIIKTDSNVSIAIELRASNNMKELLAVYNENKAQIEADPNLKSIFKEVKKAIIDKM